MSLLSNQFQLQKEAAPRGITKISVKFRSQTKAEYIS